MIGMGTIVNSILVLIGSTIGLLIKGGMKERYQKTIMNALGLSVIFIGISGTLQGLMFVEENKLQTTNVMLMIVSLAVGALIGEWIDIEASLDKFGGWLQKSLKVEGEKGNDFVEGFVNSSLLFCVGAMAIIGSLQDGLTGDPSMLIIKGVLDGVSAIFFASTLGIGVFFSAISLILYQGGITLTATFIEPLLNNSLISNISFIGSVLIMGLGINNIFGKKIKVGNLLPAMLIPVVYEIIIKTIN